MGGGTPRRVHSLPNAAIAIGMGQEEGRFLPHQRDQVVQIVRRRRPAEGRDPLRGSTVGDQPVIRAVDQLAFLMLLDGLDGEPELLLDLVVRAGVQVGDPGVHVQDGGHRVQDVLARVLLVVDERRRQRGFVVVTADDVDLFRVLDLVHPVDARLHRDPGQQVHQPPRGDRRHLRHGLGDIGEIPCGGIAESVGLGVTCDHSRCSSGPSAAGLFSAAGNVLDPIRISPTGGRAGCRLILRNARCGTEVPGSATRPADALAGRGTTGRSVRCRRDH